MLTSVSLLQIAGSPTGRGVLPRAPEWQGWLALGLLVTVFGFLVWWLFFSPLEQPVQPRPPSPGALRARRLVASLMLFSGAVGFVGGNWDELWHRLYGGFGNDFLWPPHLLLYGSSGLNGVFAGLGLAIAFRGRGGLRERFRREPLMGLLGLISTYQLASIPSDALWHQIIGPDLSAWSLPHVLLMLTGSGARLAGLALALSALPVRPWRGLLSPLPWMEAVALGLLVEAGSGTLQFLGTEFEWADPTAAQRPEWTFPVVVLVAGVVLAHLALYATRRVGAASLVAALVLALRLPVLWVDWAMLGHGPVLAATLLVLPPALALDGWYAVRRLRTSRQSTVDTLPAWGGALVYAVVFLAVALPYIARTMAVPRLDAIGSGEAVALGLPAALLAGLVASEVATWLGSLGTINAVGPHAAGRPPRQAQARLDKVTV